MTWRGYEELRQENRWLKLALAAALLSLLLSWVALFFN